MARGLEHVLWKKKLKDRVCSALRRWLWMRPYCSLPLSMGKLMKKCSQLKGTRTANWSGIF